MVRYLELLIADGHTSDNHVFLDRIFRRGAQGCMHAVARIAPGRRELMNLLPRLKSTAAAYFLEASRSAKSRGGLSRAAAEELDRYLFGIGPSALRRLPDRLLKLAVEIESINGSFLASPVRAAQELELARRFQGLPDLLEGFADQVAKAFDRDNPIRLPPRYDIATDYESAVVDVVVKNVDGPRFREVGELLKTIFNTFVPKDLRKKYRRAFDEKSLADRRRRFVRRRPRGSHQPLSGLLDEVQDLLLLPPSKCPRCRRATLRLFLVLPWLEDEAAGRSIYRCVAASCGVYAQTELRLVKQIS
jgi:hypothetical protein